MGHSSTRFPTITGNNLAPRELLMISAALTLPVTLIFCSAQRKPVTKMEAMPSPRMAVPRTRTREDWLAQTESTMEASRQSEKELHITRAGRAMMASRTARPRIPAKVPQKTAARSAP